MPQFQLDQGLANDCIRLGQFAGAELLLMNNALYPWLILVPHCAHTELYQLEAREQQILLSAINQLSAFIKQHFASEKLNIASIGNIVSQLHIHIVGRQQSDAAWPNTVWSSPQRELYAAAAVRNICAALAQYLGDSFISDHSKH